jgi:hypothetical protein
MAHNTKVSFSKLSQNGRRRETRVHEPAEAPMHQRHTNLHQETPNQQQKKPVNTHSNKKEGRTNNNKQTNSPERMKHHHYDDYFAPRDKQKKP